MEYKGKEKEGGIEYSFTAKAAQSRLDVFLAEAADISRAQAQKAIAAGRVFLNGCAVPARASVREGDLVLAYFPPPESDTALPQELPLDIVYEDSSVIVINKAQGMVVHPSNGHVDGTLVNALLYHCQNLSGVGGSLRPGIVHRLDKDTSGLLVAAKDDISHQKLSEQFHDHSARRSYFALVHGNFREDSGRVDAPLARHPVDRQKQAVVTGGRNAVTHWRVLQRLGTVTLLRLDLETGRTHQIRVHMAHIKHPVLGDALYGAEAKKWGLDGQALHGFALQFAHPKTGETLRFFAPPPAAFLRALTALGGDASFFADYILS